MKRLTPTPSELATLAAIRDGTWKAVPVEPTEAMGDAGAGHVDQEIFESPENVYRAMLAAAPAAPKEG